MYVEFTSLLKIKILSLSFQISPLGAVNDHRWLIRRTGNLLLPTSPTPISKWIRHNQTWFLCSDILILLWSLNTDNLTLSCLIGFVGGWRCQCMCREGESVLGVAFKQHLIGWGHLVCFTEPAPGTCKERWWTLLLTDLSWLDEK